MNDDVARAPGAKKTGPDLCFIPGQEEVRLAWSECALDNVWPWTMYRTTLIVSFFLPVKKWKQYLTLWMLGDPCD